MEIIFKIIIQIILSLIGLILQFNFQINEIFYVNKVLFNLLISDNLYIKNVLITKINFF
jgi:hypothetical protein